MPDEAVPELTETQPAALREKYRSVDGVCLRQDERLYYFMNPARYFSRVRDELPEEIILHETQNTYRNLSQKYLNGYGENAFPRDIKYLIQLLSTEVFRAEPAVEGFLQRLDLEQLAGVDHVDLEVVETALEVVYPILKSEIQSRSTNTPHKTTPRAVYPDSTSLEGHPCVQTLYENLSSSAASVAPLLSTFLIHGSMSTLDYTPYSDVDTMIFIDDRVFGSRGLMRTCRRALQKASSHMFAFDPLQHHRFFISPAVNLQYYPESYLPLAVMDEATSLLGTDSIDVTTRPSRREVLRSLWSLCSDFRSWYLSEKHPSKPFHLKRYTSRLMMLPTLMLEAFHDEYLYKRDSFDRAREYFTAEAWRSIDIATKLRENWRLGQTLEVSPSFYRSTFLLAEEILQRLQTLTETGSDLPLYDVN